MIRGRNKYIFYIAIDGENYDPVVLVKSPNYQGSKEEYRADFKGKTGSWKFVKHENRSLYERFLYVLQTPSSSTNPINVKVVLLNSEETLQFVVYAGYIPLESIQIDASDGGTITFTPEESGAYLWYEQNKTTKKDLVSLGNKTLHTNTITIADTSESLEFWLPLSLECEHFNNFSEIDHSDGEDNGSQIQHWTDAPGTIYTADPERLRYQYKESWVLVPDQWKYYYCIQEHSPDAWLNKPGEGLHWTEYWIKFDDYPYDNAVYHVVQQRADFALPGFVKGDGIYQPFFTKDTGDDLLATNCPEEKYCKGSPDISSGEGLISTTGNIKLFDAFNYLLEGSGLTFHSELFSSSTNPVTNLPNKYTNPFLSHRGFLKGVQDDETKGDVALEELINDICELFNCRWYIDATNEYLVIEHVNFFRNGFTYQTGSPEVYADLTDTTKYKLKDQVIFDLEGSPTDEIFKYDKNLQQKEIFKINDTYDYDNYIKYSSHFAKAGDELSHNINLLTTDLMFVIKATDKSSDDQFCLIACSDNVNSVYRRTTYMHSHLTTKEDYPNGDLMMYNIINDLWKYDRVFKNGSLNLEERVMSFFTVKKTKIQRQIRFPRMEEGKFDPQKLIKTNMGNGEVQEYEVETDSDYIAVTLIYEIDQ